MPADPRLTALRAALDDSRRVLAEAVAAVPPAQRDARPAPDRWSVAEVLEHCALVEGGSTQLVGALAAACPARAGAGEGAGHPTADAGEADATPWALDRAVFLNREVRIDAPAFLHPSGALDAEGAWARLEAARAALLAALEAADGRALEAATRPHPVFGPLNAYQWVSAVAGHEARHAAQIREIAGRTTAGASGVGA